MVLLQSYASPVVLSADQGVYRILNSKYSDLKCIFKKSGDVQPIHILSILWLSFKSNFVSKKNELIFAWGGDLCLYAWFWGHVLHLNRKYLGQNLIFRTKSGLKNNIRFYLYKKALHSDNFFMTVNAKKLVDYYSKLFDCATDKFTVVYDSMELSEKQGELTKGQTRLEDKLYVFFGGSAARDVPTFLKLVENLPEVKFMAVVKEHMITPEMSQYNNLEVFCDIPEEDFYSRLCDATVCCIPLDSKAPCGLYTMQKAIMLHTPIVSTDTSSMRTIVPDDSCGYLLPMGDVEGLKSKLTTLLRDKNLRTQLADAALANFDKFKPENVGKRLVEEISSL